MSYNPNNAVVLAEPDLQIRRPQPRELDEQAETAAAAVLDRMSRTWLDLDPAASDHLVEAHIPTRRVKRLGRTAVIAALRLAAEETAVMHRAQERNLAVAHLALNAVSEQSQDASKPASMLLEKVNAAVEGDAEADAALGVEGQSEVAEQICKAGAVLEAEAYVNDQGELVQYGAATEQRQFNALRTFGRDTELQATFINEGQNALFIEEAHRAGLLKDNRLVEFALVPKASRRVLAKQGYFLREVIAIIRVTTVHADGSCKIESVLVGGTDQDRLPEFRPDMTAKEEAAIEEQALANRFDIDVVRGVYEMIGVPGAAQMGPAEFLGSPLLMSKKFDSMHLAGLYDTVAARLLRKRLMLGLTELGKQLPHMPRRADYLSRRERSLAFQDQLKPLGRSVANQLKLRRVEAKNSQAKMSRLFRDIAKDFAVAYLAADKATDARVYGSKTYGHILEARERFEANDPVAAQRAIKKGQEEARPTGCPTAAEESDDEDEAAIADRDAKEKRNKMRWTKGVCQITLCPTKGDNPQKPKTTMVGECSICWSCQKKFDQGLELETIIALYVARKVRSDRAKPKKTRLALGA